MPFVAVATLNPVPILNVPIDGKKDGDDLDHDDSRSVLTAKLDAAQFVLNIFSALAQFERRLIQKDCQVSGWREW